MKKYNVIMVIVVMIIAIPLGIGFFMNEREVSTTDSGIEDKAMLNRASELVDDLLNHRFSVIHNQSSEVLKNALSEQALAEAWDLTIVNAGEFVQENKQEKTVVGVYTVVSTFLDFEHTGIVVSLTFGDEMVIEGVNLNFYQLENNSALELPKSLTEKSHTVVTGDYQLPAALTTKEGNSKDKVLLLVHGSGPNDMNESIYGTAVFRDIAWGVAQMGIDVFRYDKRTFVYQENITPKGSEYTTVNEEVIQDALSAAKLLKAEGYKEIYLVGHSLGGMLGPRIISESPELFAGFISLAGSPRTLSQVQLSQNEAAIMTLEGASKEEAIAIVEAEEQKLVNVNHFTEQELLTETIFGISAYYVKDINAYDTIELTKKLDIPMLFLQGSDDFQITVDDDFRLWQEGLKEKEGVTFKVYEGLTHLFTPSPENPTYTINDYKVTAFVSDEVIMDLYHFVSGTVHQ